MAFDLPFSPKTPPLIGLDIGSSSVKIVELSEAGKGVMRLERYAIEPLPRGAVVDGNIDKIEVVADAVKRAWRRAGGKVRNVAMALPASAVITQHELGFIQQPVYRIGGTNERAAAEATACRYAM